MLTKSIAELVREYLEYLLESHKGRSAVSGHLSAIRTLFDRFCFFGHYAWHLKAA